MRYARKTWALGLLLGAAALGCQADPPRAADLEQLAPPEDERAPLDELTRVGPDDPRPLGQRGLEAMDAKGVIARPPTSLLVQAVQADEREQVRTLLQAGADPNGVDARGQTPLTAFFSGRNWRAGEPMLALLLEFKADPNGQDAHGVTPLHGAVERGRLSHIQRLLAAGARPITADAEGRTPLHRAVELDRLEEAGLLLDHQADPLARDRKGRSPLHLAVHRDAFWMVRLLADRPGALTALDGEGNTPLHLAVARENLDVASLLIERGADPEQEDEAGNRPIAWLARRCVALLASHLDRPGAVSDHVCATSPALRSASLFQAAAEDQGAVVELLLSHGASPSDQHGFHPGLGTRSSALHVAAWAGHAQMVERLLRAGARADALDANGWTPLHTAVWQGHYQTAERLLRAGARPALLTRSGETALDLARQREHQALVRLLSGARPH